MLKKLFQKDVHSRHREFYQRAGVTDQQFDAHWMPFSGNRSLNKSTHGGGRRGTLLDCRRWT